MTRLLSFRSEEPDPNRFDLILATPQSDVLIQRYHARIKGNEIHYCSGVCLGPDPSSNKERSYA